MESQKDMAAAAKPAADPAQPTTPSRLSAIMAGKPKVPEGTIHKLNLGGNLHIEEPKDLDVQA